MNLNRVSSGRSPTSIKVTEPAVYYANRVTALNLVRQEKWQEAKSILKELTEQFHQSGEPEDHRIWIAPHVPVSLSSDEYFSGKDPAMDAIFRIIGYAGGQ